MLLKIAKSSLFFVFFATPLLLSHPETQAAEKTFPISKTVTLAQTNQERQAEADELYEQGIEQARASQLQEAIARRWQTPPTLWAVLTLPLENTNDRSHFSSNL